jgi:spore maturation protein CgeB
MFFAHHKGFSEYLKSIGVDAYYIPLGFYPDQYPYRRQTKIIPISFMGNAMTAVNGSDKRVKYVKALKYQNIRVWGKSFRNKGVRARPYKSHELQCEIYAKSKVNLDLPFINSEKPFYKDTYHLKNRFFEVPATCNFLMTARCDDFTDILGENMVGYYEDNIDDLRAVVNRYLKDDKLCRVMAKKAYIEVMAKHTFGHRFKEMFDIMGV